MSLLQTSKGALDPSYFLKCLKQILEILLGWKSCFQSIFPAAEILPYILEELCGESIHASESIRISYEIEYLLHSMSAVDFN